MPDVQTILDPLPIPKSVKADAYDAYTGATSTDDLKARLDKLPLANGVKANLWDLKANETTAPAPSTAAGPSDDSGNWLLHNPVSDTLAGIGSGVISTGVGAYNLARKIPGADKVLPAPNSYVQQLTQAPDSIMGQVGKWGEQAGEFILPVGEAIKGAQLGADALKAGPWATRALKLGAETAAATGTAGIQSGGDPDAMASMAKWSAALGAVGAVAPPAVKALYNATVKRAITAAPRPLSQAAQDIGERYGAQLTQGILGGSKAIQTLERSIGSTPAGADMWEPILERNQQAANRGAQDLAGNFKVDQYAAGDQTAKTMTAQAQQHAGLANQAYSKLADLEADPANVQTVQTGTKTNAYGQTEPITQDLGLPVDMRGVKEQLAPIAQEIGRYMAPAQRSADPGLEAVKNILSRPDYLPASAAEGDLGFLKQIMRSAAPAQAKRIAGAAIEALDSSIRDTVSQVPGGLDTLDTARSNWAAKSDIEDTLKSISGDTTGADGQVRLTQHLTAPADTNIGDLEKVLNVAPGAGEAIGKGFLTGRVFKSIAQDGADFTNPNQARNLWNQLGPRTKALLYTPEQIADMNGLFQFAKRVSENPNPSGSGFVLNALQQAGAFIQSPLSTTGRTLINRQIAKLLYYPEGMATLRTVATEAGTPAGDAAARAVKSMLEAEPPAAAAGATRPIPTTDAGPTPPPETPAAAAPATPPPTPGPAPAAAPQAATAPAIEPEQPSSIWTRRARAGSEAHK